MPVRKHMNRIWRAVQANLRAFAAVPTRAQQRNAFCRGNR